MKRRISVVRVLAGIILVLVVNQASSAGTGRKFYNDDPLTREPESQDASKCRRPVTVEGRALALQGAGRPADLTCHVGHRGAAGTFGFSRGPQISFSAPTGIPRMI